MAVATVMQQENGSKASNGVERALRRELRARNKSDALAVLQGQRRDRVRRVLLTQRIDHLLDERGTLAGCYATEKNKTGKPTRGSQSARVRPSLALA